MDRRCGWCLVLLVLPACVAQGPTRARPGAADVIAPTSDPRGGVATPPRDDAPRPQVPWGWKRREGPTPWGQWQLGPRERDLPYEYDPDRGEYRFRQDPTVRPDVVVPELPGGECPPVPPEAVDPLS